MLTRADLDEAVRNGIITQQQSAALQGLPAARQLVRHRHAQGDERFIFMKNFNEFFIALGVVLLGVGLWAAAGAFPHFAVAFPVIFIAVMWALAEFLTRRLKLTLPSIVLAIFIVTTLAFLLKDSLSDSSSLLIASFSAAVSALLFYLRFRLPFALLLLAGGCVAAFFAIFTSLIGEPTQLFTYAMFLIAGIATLAAAQWSQATSPCGAASLGGRWTAVSRKRSAGAAVTKILWPLIAQPPLSSCWMVRFHMCTVGILRLGSKMRIGGALLC